MMIQSHHYYYLTSLLLLLLYTLASPTLGDCRHDQRDALLEFKDEFPSLWLNPSANDTSLSSWNKSSTDCCSWEGITCDAKSGQVISISLIDIFFNNSLKPNSNLFKLHHLHELRLRNCSLYGEIPSTLGNLSFLTYLNLGVNNLVGQIPESLGNLTQLTQLVLSVNNLIGKVPVSFANLTKLSTVIIHNNFLESKLPDMSGFHSLEQFDLGDNSFFGPFPTSLFTIPSLSYVNLTGNQFEGPIEFKNISSLSRLGYLFLGENKFDGPIPKSITEFLNLQVLDLSRNSFIGSIPKSISNLVKLDFIDLSKNKLEGQVPGCLWGLTAMILSHNSFSSFEKSNETHMELLDVQSNLFRGPFPYWICKLRSLRQLDLSNNSLSGSIPQCLWNATNSLGVFLLRSNNFSGIFPDIFSNATKLEAFDISRNHFQGKLPKSLTNCTGLEFLNVESNRIKDKFPFLMGSLPSLSILILRSNQFFGPLYHHNVSIGFQSLKVIDVSHNDFTGTLPPFYFSNWSQMSTLSGESSDTYMEDPAHYVGVFRNSMELVHKGVDTEFARIRRDFRAIDFSGNRFVGNIPQSIGLLKELRVLNLSGNAFTSNIPQALANLTKLEALDLSQNQLSGRIPRDLGSLSFLSVMNFSHNNLEGPIPQGTQFQRQKCSVFMDNPKLFGLEDICGEITHIPESTPQESEDLSEPEEQVISWIAAAIAYVPGVFCGLVIGHIFASHKQKWFIEKFGRNKWRTPIRSTH